MDIRRLATAVISGALALTSLSACDPLKAEPAAPYAASNPTGATAQLNSLVVSSWAAMTGYSRDRFHHWDSQGDGCDTRDVVLKRDGQDVVAGNSCAISRGTWFSPYDGKSLTSPDDIDIDHMVPLANAWRTGAATWTDQQREAFANDLTRPQLLAVSLSSNRSKGDQDPSQWKPPRHEYWCAYAQRWISVKVYWKLNINAAEKTALTEMLGTCS